MLKMCYTRKRNFEAIFPLGLEAFVVMYVEGL